MLGGSNRCLLDNAKARRRARLPRPGIRAGRPAGNRHLISANPLAGRAAQSPDPLRLCRRRPVDRRLPAWRRRHPGRSTLPPKRPITTPTRTPKHPVRDRIIGGVDLAASTRSAHHCSLRRGGLGFRGCSTSEKHSAVMCPIERAALRRPRRGARVSVPARSPPDQ